ncbi:MAG: hypothetical protein E5X43_28340 [Mesorhizobium sp.]|nr:MAG: hypothetical protein E5X43_28340 [Mesorhizobium sp.]
MIDRSGNSRKEARHREAADQLSRGKMLKFLSGFPPFSDPKGFFWCGAICFGLVTGTLFWVGSPLSLTFGAIAVASTALAILFSVKGRT